MKKFTFKGNDKNFKIDSDIIFYPKRFVAIISFLVLGFIIWKVWF